MYFKIQKSHSDPTYTDYSKCMFTNIPYILFLGLSETKSPATYTANEPTVPQNQVLR
jgi:hypothetical protein